MTKHWADDAIPVDRDALVDEQEVAAIKRTTASFAAVAHDYALRNTTRKTLRTVEAALAILEAVFTLQPNEAEALQEQVNRAVRGRTALPAAQPQQPSSQQVQPYSGGQPPAVVQGANAALERALLGLLSRLRVPVYIPHNGQLDSQMLNSLIQDAHGKVRELEERANQADDLQQQLDNRQQQPQSNPHWAPLNPAPVDPTTGPIPAGDFIPRAEISDIVTQIDEARAHGNGPSSTLGLIHPTGMMGLTSSVSPDDRKDREELVETPLDKLYQLGRPNSRNRSGGGRRNPAR